MNGRERIRGEGLSYTYLTRAGETLALKHLDLVVCDGEFCSIVGPSGCGKSTLLAIISGLLRQPKASSHGGSLSGPRAVGILFEGSSVPVADRAAGRGGA
jgi:ABC-type nitrate/sulfonate/bicarbonate transport system ATPase subunit